MPTVSEQLFEEYLQTRGLAFEREKGDVVHPDYFLYISGKQLVCEVHQLERKTPLPKFFTSSQPFKKLRVAIKKKVRQGKEAKGQQIPYAIVLFSMDPVVMTSNVAVMAAMYGDPVFTFNILPLSKDKKQRVPIEDPKPQFGGNGIIRHARGTTDAGVPHNKRVSAVIMLDCINPTQEVFDKEYEKAVVGITDLDGQFKVFNKVNKKLRKEGRYNDNTVPRVRVFHNFYTTTSLGFDVFTGQYDEQYYIDPETGATRKYE